MSLGPRVRGLILALEVRSTGGCTNPQCCEELFRLCRHIVIRLETYLAETHQYVFLMNDTVQIFENETGETDISVSIKLCVCVSAASVLESLNYQESFSSFLKLLIYINNK